MDAAALGEEFVRSLAVKSGDRLRSILAPNIDFKGLTPGRAWEANDVETLLNDVLWHWFEEQDHVEDVLAVDSGTVADRHSVTYRLAVTNPDGRYLVQQNAYFDIADNRISLLRIMCSGYRPVE